MPWVKAENAIRKIEKATGQKLQLNSNGKSWWLKYKDHYLSFSEQHGKVGCFTIRYEKDHDDPSSDYFAGVYARSIKQALSLLGV